MIIDQICRKDMPFIPNPSWKKRFSASLKMAVSFALSERAEGIFLSLGDMSLLKLSDSQMVVQKALDNPKVFPDFRCIFQKAFFPLSFNWRGTKAPSRSSMSTTIFS